MFTKYQGQLGNAEAEWVLEILDAHGCGIERAEAAVMASLDRLMESDQLSLTDFDRSVEACCFANPTWWPEGLNRLRLLGKLPTKVGVLPAMQPHSPIRRPA